MLDNTFARPPNCSIFIFKLIFIPSPDSSSPYTFLYKGNISGGNSGRSGSCTGSVGSHRSKRRKRRKRGIRSESLSSRSSSSSGGGDGGGGKVNQQKAFVS